MSAFWMVYPVISELPSSVGGSHSSAALKPQMSVTLTFRGGPGFSEWINNQLLNWNQFHLFTVSANDIWNYFMCRSWRSRFHLTNNPDVNGGSVLHVLNLEHQVVYAGVLSLRWADEEDAVHVWVADVDHLGVDGLTVLVPGCDRAWFTLRETRIIYPLIYSLNLFVWRPAMCQLITLRLQDPALKHDHFARWVLKNTCSSLQDTVLLLTWKGMVRLIFSPTFLMYLVLRSRGRRILGCSKAEHDDLSKTFHHIKKNYYVNHNTQTVEINEIVRLTSESYSPMISRMVTGCDITAGGLRPAIFTATTLKFIFSPTGRPRTTYTCLSQSSLFATTHSVSEISVIYKVIPVIGSLTFNTSPF